MGFGCFSCTTLEFDKNVVWLVESCTVVRRVQILAEWSWVLGVKHIQGGTMQSVVLFGRQVLILLDMRPSRPIRVTCPLLLLLLLMRPVLYSLLYCWRIGCYSDCRAFAWGFRATVLYNPIAWRTRDVIGLPRSRFQDNFGDIGRNFTSQMQTDYKLSSFYNNSTHF